MTQLFKPAIDDEPLPQLRSSTRIAVSRLADLNIIEVAAPFEHKPSRQVMRNSVLLLSLRSGIFA
ncbi:MAG: hypothetical protein CL583_01370 [Alteromonadaceae bacterium]|uniref:Uncharacterized protein n=1 Tax=Hydrocarboniclastica marina TaxID=2259620 RepID=A0A4P7XEZ4_9ALTE|nr:hypothetical protein [Alteromonadaceae bacterium]QCF25491.1 hypothetical protein soil367_05855 [Hydrocarboniclastica marina]